MIIFSSYQTTNTAAATFSVKCSFVLEDAIIKIMLVFAQHTVCILLF